MGLTAFEAWWERVGVYLVTRERNKDAHGLAAASWAACSLADQTDPARFRWLIDEAQAQHWQALWRMPEGEREYIDAAMKKERE